MGNAILRVESRLLSYIFCPYCRSDDMEFHLGNPLSIHRPTEWRQSLMGYCHKCGYWYYAEPQFLSYPQRVTLLSRIENLVREMKFDITLRIKNGLKKIGNFSYRTLIRVWNAITPVRLGFLSIIAWAICFLLQIYPVLRGFFLGVDLTAMLWYYKKDNENKE